MLMSMLSVCACGFELHTPEATNTFSFPLLGLLPYKDHVAKSCVYRTVFCVQGQYQTIYITVDLLTSTGHVVSDKSKCLQDEKGMFNAR